MKHNYYISLILTTILFHTITQAQVQCPSDYNYRLPEANNPQQQLKAKQDIEKIKEISKNNYSRSLPPADTLRIIPIVVHVLYDNASTPISKADILAGIDIM